MKYICRHCNFIFNYYVDNWFENTVFCPECGSDDIITQTGWVTTSTMDL